jgi:hypothetical protein
MYDADANFDIVRERTLCQGYSYLQHLIGPYWKCEDRNNNPILIEHQLGEHRILIFKFYGEVKA